MDRFELENLIEKIVGSRLISIRCACEMMMFTFGNYALHTQCMTRIIKNGDLLVTTLDYHMWDEVDDKKNDEWYNLDKYRTIIEGGTVTCVSMNALCDLVITLDNDITIEVLIQHSYAHYADEREQYRFFEIEPDDIIVEQKEQFPHYVIYSKHIDIN